MVSPPHEPVDKRAGPASSPHAATTPASTTRALAEVGDVAEIRARASSSPRPSRADSATAWLLGVGFVGFALGCAAGGALPGWKDVALATALVGVYGIARRTELVGPTGSTVPTEPVLVALLFTVPVGLVPLLVLIGLFLSASLHKGGGNQAHRLAVRAASGWHSAGPVAVLWASGVHTGAFRHWPVLVGALAAQFFVDTVVATVRCVALGARLRTLVRPLRFTFAVDALLAPLSLAGVVAGGHSAVLVVLSVAPVALLRLLATDRNERYSTAITLSRALSSVQSEARSDSLSGLANRRAWSEALIAADERRGNGPGSTSSVVLMADLDYLKLVNDTLGHDAGDELIRAFASILATMAPSGAVVARLGGDEFGVLFDVTGDAVAEGQALRERVQNAIATFKSESSMRLSASIGTAACPPAISPSEAARVADAALGRDKRSRPTSRDANRPLVIL